MNAHEIITELKGVLAQSDLERTQAIEHLFSILDGDDRQTAIGEARAWLKSKYGEDYDMLSAVSRRVYQTSNGVDWPHELEVSL